MDITGDIVYLVLGAGLLLAAALPRLTNRRAVSAAMGFVGVGLLVGLTRIPAPVIDPEASAEVTRRLTEVSVIVALMGVGLAIDRPLRWRTWTSTWRLLAIAMPLCIAGVALLGWGLMGLVPASALLLGAVLAPTDPVLASDVQVGEPNSDETEDNVRFAITSEAGLNDGLAFPFVYAAIFLATQGAPSQWLGRWVAWELTGKVIVGALAGALVGYGIVKLAFRAHKAGLRFAESNEAVVALAATFLSYGVAEALSGYGFVAVFGCALAIRNFEREHEYHRVLHAFTQQIERLLTLVLLLLLGVASATGLLDELTWQGALVGGLLVLVLRPVLAWVSLAGDDLDRRERWAASFFGVRGIGSFFYIAYAAGEATFPRMGELWSTVAFTVLLSVVVHGVAASPVMEHLDRRREKAAVRAQGAPA